MKSYSFFLKKEQVFKIEQRLNKRYKYNNRFKVESINMKQINLEVMGIDISIGGIGFISTLQLNLNDILEISFKFNNITIPATIKIQHINLFDSGFFIGGQFIALQNSYISILRDLI